jgi:hypothetical protein
MDDFLHNLRSGKLKQPERSNRHFNDPQYKGAPRRNPMDRRKRDFDNNKESTERLGAIKEVLETLTETQKRMAEAYEARTRAEERKARAMEVLAKNLYRMLNPNAKDVDALFAPTEPDAPQQVDSPETDTFESAAEDNVPSEDFTSPENIVETHAEAETDIHVESDPLEEPDQNGRKLSTEDRKRVYAMAGRLRDEGNSWENIARQITTQGYPTVSGKGTWRGVMIKNLYEKMVVGE